MLPTRPLRSELVRSPASMLSIGVHSLHAAFGNPQLCMFNTTTMIPPFQLLQADYPLTILGIQYDDSMVIILRGSANALDNSDCADALLQIRKYP